MSVLAGNWKLEGIRQVRLMMGQGYRRFDAQKDVARQLGFTVNDLQTWERELVQNPDLEHELLCSELAGEYLDRLLVGHYTSIPNYKSFGTYHHHYNFERAAEIVKTRKNYSLREISAALRGVRRT